MGDCLTGVAKEEGAGMEERGEELVKVLLHDYYD